MHAAACNVRARPRPLSPTTLCTPQKPTTNNNKQQLLQRLAIDREVVIFDNLRT